MLGFFLKKSFFDGFDNFWKLVVLNIIFGLFIVLGVFLPLHVFSGNFNILLISFLFVSFFLSLYSFGANYFLFKWSCYEQGSLKDCLRNYKGKFKLIVIHTILSYSIFLVIPLSQYLYISGGKLLGLFATLLLFDLEIVFFMIHQYFYPVCFYYDSDGASVLKRCLAIAVDNFGYSFLLILRTVIDFAITVLSFSTVPGICGIGLARMDMVRFLTRRYQYIEANNGISKKDADWKLILANDLESTGKRTFRNMIFPWKD